MEGTSLVVQWLRLHISIAGGVGSIPDGEGAAKKKKKKKENVASFHQPYQGRILFLKIIYLFRPRCTACGILVP